MRHLTLTLVFLTLLACKKSNKPETQVSNEPVELQTSIIASGLIQPWEIIFGPDEQLWITERAGKISKVNPVTKQITPLITIADVVANGEGGLLGMVLHPNFETSPFVYVVYNYNASNGYKEKVVRYTFTNNTLSNPTVIIQDITASNIHNGSRLLISADNKLIMTTGDAANTSLSQNMNSLSGKILRLNLDGSVPADNPFAGSYIYTLGHRNSQGLAFVGNKLFSSEHGPNTDDEVNLIEPGRNYGWPNVAGFCDNASENAFCAVNNVAEPLINWTPTIATAGLTYYNNDAIPQWKNSLLLTTLKASKIVQLKLNSTQTAIDSQQDFYANEFGRKRAICVGKQGEVYFITGNGNDDKIVMISAKQ
ncbi:PQQ-dependent sugar dehydrogenase [Pedobacter alpinus]|uniref:PQQ-dependent sugar dehydrogenase n=1 Tax=Pedobacter alpinus TaxID=1590643 RepID=A0ABW5TWV1_9SPHI